MTKHLSLYLAIFLVFGSATYLVLRSGSQLEQSKIEIRQESFVEGIQKTFSQNFKEPISKLLLQLIIIILLARSMGSLFQRIGQPAVIGEMIAGILFGSFFAWNCLSID